MVGHGFFTCYLGIHTGELFDKLIRGAVTFYLFALRFDNIMKLFVI